MHYTLQAGPYSGVIDLHETTIDADGRKHHRTLFALRRDDLPPVLHDFPRCLPSCSNLVRPLRLGWIVRHGIGIARGVDPISDQDIAAVTRKRKGRRVLDARLYEQNLFIPKYLEEVYEFPDGPFAHSKGGGESGLASR